ncbi:MAG: LysR family transcriptional regulator [Gammaproteobacteria bacterium]|nr:LysR family transcriptional regulator [Gammaproteobacteria bacterium]
MLEDISAFCAIVKFKSFSKAAKELGISKPVISRRIMRLEKQLDTRLLQRTTRKVALTEEGDLYYKEVSEILLALETSKKNIKSLNKEVSGTLKIGAPASISNLYLTQFINKFITEYPNLKIQIVNGNHLFDLLNNGFDLVIYCGELPNSSYHYKKIGTWKKITCASSEYLKKYNTPKIPQDLQGHNCLDHYDNINRTWKFSEKGTINELQIKGNILTNSSMDLKNLAVNHIGVAYLPDFTISSELKNKKLISILSQYQLPSLGIYAVYPTNKFLSKKTEVFIKFLTQFFDT